MKLNPRPIVAEPEGEARDWLIRLLDDDVPEADLLAFSRWLGADEANRQAYEGASAAWEAMGSANLTRPTPAELAHDDYDPAVPISRWRRGRRAKLRLAWSAAAGVGLAAILVLGLGVVVLRNLPYTSNLVTARGQHLEARLADGSSVRLGAMTRLNVTFDRSQRAIGMAAGEALFQVAHNPARPFVVKTPLASVTAVGTAFNLDVAAQAVTLAVTEGRVDVRLATGNERGSGDGRVLKVAAGYRLRMERTGARLLVLQEETAVAPAWTEGRLEYRDEPLRLVLADVNRYAARPIILASPELGELSFTGTVQVGATEAWAQGLPAAFPVSVEVNKQQLILRRRTASAAR